MAFASSKNKLKKWKKENRNQDTVVLVKQQINRLVEHNSEARKRLS